MPGFIFVHLAFFFLGLVGFVVQQNVAVAVVKSTCRWCLVAQALLRIFVGRHFRQGIGIRVHGVHVLHDGAILRALKFKLPQSLALPINQGNVKKRLNFFEHLQKCLKSQSFSENSSNFWKSFLIF